MQLDPDFRDDLVDLVKSVSDTFSEDAEDLLREDQRSLRQYLGSEAFLEDLLAEELAIDLPTDYFFFILFHQLYRKFQDEETFEQDFKEALNSRSNQTWETSSIRQFLEDERLLFYLVNMLGDFVETEQVHQIPSLDDREFHYVFEMIEASRTSTDSQSYRIFCHIGNYSLYLTGVFPDWIRYRHERKNRPMDVNDYSDFGKTYFNKASKHRLARKQRMEPVLKKLSEGYDLVRTSLEMLFKRVLPASG